MTPTLSACARGVMLLASVSLGCAAQSQALEVEFPAGTHASVEGILALELTWAEYREQGVALRLTVRNDSTTDVTIAREGILLAYGSLEFPLDLRDLGAPPEAILVPAKGAAKLKLAFATGSRVEQTATLRLRAMRQGQRWLAAGKVELPPAPLSTLQEE
ncbi:MAG: hypothetical protein JKY37_12405 [Nannocystaceae bacterium]|nr:hypothetical protein [Nannocystaceae bacterium]